MIYKLSPLNTETLKKMPESGMGYQIVKTVKTNYMDETLIVLNGKLAINGNALKFTQTLKAIIGNDLQKAIESSTEKNINILGIIPETKIIGSFVSEDSSYDKKNAMSNTTENANGDELFVRLSAFEDDIRIDKLNKCLLPGSFTTTSSDALRCKVEKDDPSNRYALPNELEIKWAFYIEPKPNDILKRGFVESKFSKKGGGREVYFEKGTSNSTFITQTKW